MNAEIDIDQFYNHALRLFDLVCDGNIVYGWHQKSANGKVSKSRRSSIDIYWLSVRYKYTDKQSKLFTGIPMSQKIRDVRKSLVIDSIVWEDGIYTVRADLLSYIDERACSLSPVLHASIPISTGRIDSLDASLHALADVQSDRMSARDVYIKKRITTWFDIDTEIVFDDRCVSHGDLHWANLTCDTCYILDREGRGNAPRGLDISTLFVYSLLVPQVTDLLYAKFHEILRSPQGIVLQLFACAERIHMHEHYGDHPALRVAAQAYGDKLIRDSE